MLTRLAFAVAAAAAMASSGLALAQTPPLPPRDCGEFACPPRPAPGKLPSDEARALGQKLVTMLDSRAIAARTGELVKIGQAKDPPPPQPPAWPNGPIRAVPPVDLANYPTWGFAVQQRVIEHAALYYARKYTLDQLRQMVAFFESPAGQAHVAERQSNSPTELREMIARPLLEHDLWNVVCAIPVPSEVEDAPHHEFHRLHPPTPDDPRPAPKPWCASIEVRSQYRP